jgi:hypothetical protein
MLPSPMPVGAGYVDSLARPNQIIVSHKSSELEIFFAIAERLTEK